VSETERLPRFPVYVTGSTDAPRALIVLQEAFGVNDHIRDVADRFADAGFFVVAPHLFHRTGSPEVPYDDIDHARSLIGELTHVGLTNDLNATTDFLRSLGYGPTSIGVVGFCMGGSVALYVATLTSVGAAVTFYGGGVRTPRMGLAPLGELAPELKAPWLGLFGDLDTGIPIEDVETLREAAAKASVATEVVRYANAGHGFHCDARPAGYNEEAASDAFRRTLDFFGEWLQDK
jgi:carboxymethylenebutenolidase